MCGGLANFEQINLKELDRKIRIGAVSYLNTLPLVYGLQKGEISSLMELSFDYPARVAQALLEDSVDVGLIPVAMMPKIKDAHIISDYCIAASGPVASVCIFAEMPLEELTHIYLDYQSRTSVNLARILLKEYWKLEVAFLPAENNFIDKIGGTTGAVIIGDRALKQLSVSKFSYDLAEAWIEHTGLPFVFAAWVANKALPQNFIDAFNNATGEGLEHLDEIVRGLNVPYYDLKKYYSEDVDYKLDESKLKAIKLFHEKLLHLG